ncbi:hypothetical protein ARMGADRAFT_1110805 [Armillaria gallica]|uniref:Uncharacterized protein n=1 Tax=Armillaria gallica TaxID=47427 RepID=A0A2H3D6N2_ARMGA|nr:hypothetical protein ARMGADRAFT_1110805 [Armillaria gallica]
MYVALKDELIRDTSFKQGRHAPRVIDPIDPVTHWMGRMKITVLTILHVSLSTYASDDVILIVQTLKVLLDAECLPASNCVARLRGCRVAGHTKLAETRSQDLLPRHSYGLLGTSTSYDTRYEQVGPFLTSKASNSLSHSFRQLQWFQPYPSANEEDNKKLALSWRCGKWLYYVSAASLLIDFNQPVTMVLSMMHKTRAVSSDGTGAR